MTKAATILSQRVPVALLEEGGHRHRAETLGHDARALREHQPGEQRADERVAERDPQRREAEAEADLAGVADEEHGAEVGRAVGEGAQPGTDVAAPEEELVHGPGAFAAVDAHPDHDGHEDGDDDVRDHALPPKGSAPPAPRPRLLTQRVARLRPLLCGRAPTARPHAVNTGVVGPQVTGGRLSLHEREPAAQKDTRGMCRLARRRSDETPKLRRGWKSIQGRGPACRPARAPSLTRSGSPRGCRSSPRAAPAGSPPARRRPPRRRGTPRAAPRARRT